MAGSTDLCVSIDGLYPAVEMRASMCYKSRAATPPIFCTSIRSIAMNRIYRRASLWLAFLSISALIITSASSGAEKRMITEMDLFKFAWIADPQISPDGSRVVFVRVWVNQKADRYDSALWIVPTNGGPNGEKPRQLTAGPRDSSPRWSPDGKQLAFVRSVEKEGRPQPPQIYLLTFDGGEAQSLTDLPRGAGAPQWSPDGKTIAFTSRSEERRVGKECRF